MLQQSTNSAKLNTNALHTFLFVETIGKPRLILLSPPSLSHKNPILHLELCAFNMAEIRRKSTVTKTLTLFYLSITIKMTTTVTKEEALSVQLWLQSLWVYFGRKWHQDETSCCNDVG